MTRSTIWSLALVALALVGTPAVAQSGLSFQLAGGVGVDGPAGRIGVGRTLGDADGAWGVDAIVALTASGITTRENDPSDFHSLIAGVVRRRVYRGERLDVTAGAGAGLVTAIGSYRITDPAEVARRQETGFPLTGQENALGIVAPLEVTSTWWLGRTVGIGGSALAAVRTQTVSTSRTSLSM